MRDLPQIIDYDKEQLAYALANAIKERDEAREAWYEMQSSFERSRDEVEKLIRERDEALEALEYIAHAGLSARHIEDYAKDFLRRKEAAK